jgi:NADH-quinone oxidoreductase subunit K
MMHLGLPIVLVAVLAGAGVYGVVARRNAVLVLIGVELILSAANLLLVTMGSVLPDPMRAGQVLALFVITIAAAEVGVALAVVLAMFRMRGHIDLTQPASDEAHPLDAPPPPRGQAGEQPHSPHDPQHPGDLDETHAPVRDAVTRESRS